jgi:hypothetical protein
MRLSIVESCEGWRKDMSTVDIAGEVRGSGIKFERTVKGS